MTLATRILTLRRPEGEIAVAVTLFAPQPGPHGGWFCPYAIDWPEEPRHGEGWGVDPIQALHLTLQIIGAHLYASPEHEAGQLVWKAPGDGYGFPVPKTLRDLLVGTDRIYDGE